MPCRSGLFRLRLDPNKIRAVVMADLQSGASDLQLAGTTVSFGGFTGRTRGVRRWSDSYVHAASTGGQMIGSAYSQNAMQVHTMVTHKMEFFVTDDTGRQHPVQVSGCDIPLADGQRVTVVTAGVATGGTWPAVLADHDSSQSYLLSDKALAVNLGLIPSDLAAFNTQKRISYLFLLFIMPAFASVPFACIAPTAVGPWFLLFAAGAFASWSWRKQKIRARQVVVDRLANHLHNLGRQAL